MKFTARQFVIYSSLYLSYTLYVYVRRSFSFSVPAIASEEKLDKSQFGLITTSQSIAYAISKFVSGILVDIFSPKLLLSAGLISSGVTAFVFTGFESAVVLSCLWFLNGLAQGPGWPAAAVILKEWCAPDLFGTAWSILSTSMNLAGTIGPLVTAFIVSRTGWKYCMQVAGSFSVTFGFLCMILIKNKPGDGSIKMQNEDSNSKSSADGKSDRYKKEKSNSSTGIKNKTENADRKPCKSSENKMSRLELLHIPGYLGVCLAYLVTTLVQYGTLQWGQLYIVQEKGQSLLMGSGFTSSLEVGGIVGSFIAGFMSDHLILKNPGLPRHLVRQILVTYFLFLLAIITYVFTYCITEHSSKVVITAIGFSAGFCIYGPISIFGVIAMEIAPENMAGTSHAFAGLFSNVGMMIAGYPLTFIAKTYNWQAIFLLQGTILIVTVISLVFKLKSELSSFPVEKYRKVLWLS